MWIRVLGSMSINQEGNTTYIDLNHKNQIYKCTLEEKGDTQVLEVKGVEPKDGDYGSHLKKVCYKATYCIHC